MTLLGIALLSGAGFEEMFTITLYFGWGYDNLRRAKEGKETTGR